MSIGNFIAILLLSLMLSGTREEVYAQPFPFCTPCKDTTKLENEFFSCFQDYNPVCACDGKTYRNDCFAINKYNFYPCGYYSGICGSFDIDLQPSLIDPIDNTINIKAFMNSSGYLSVNIINYYGRIQYQNVFPMAQNVFPGPSLGPYNSVSIDVSSWNQGLYLIEAIYQGERKVLKILKPTSLF